MEAIGAQGVGHVQHVLNQVRHPIRRHLRGACSGGVSALVEGHGAAARRGKLRDAGYSAGPEVGGTFWSPHCRRRES